MFRRFNEFGVTLLIASHDIALIDKFGCRRVELENGRCVDDSTDDDGAAFVVEAEERGRWQ